MPPPKPDPAPCAVFLVIVLFATVSVPKLKNTTYVKCLLVLSDYTPMARTQVREPFHQDGWVYEEKVDDWRMLAYKDGSRVRLVSRNGRDHTRRFHQIVSAVSKLREVSEMYDLIARTAADSPYGVVSSFSVGQVSTSGPRVHQALGRASELAFLAAILHEGWFRERVQLDL